MNQTNSTEKQITSWTTNQVVFATVFVVGVFLIFWLLYFFRAIIFLLFVAIVIGTAIRPAVEWLQRRGISRSTGVILMYVFIASVVVGFLALILPLIADQAIQISRTIPQYYTAFRDELLSRDNRLLQNIARRIPAQLSLLLNQGSTESASDEILNQVSQTIFYANLGFRGVLEILAVFIMAYYWTQESSFIIRTVLRLVPLHRRNDIQDFIYQIEQKIGGYIRGQGILCVLVGVAAFFAYTLIGLPYTLVLGVIAGIMELVPVFGPALGAIPALLAALSTDPSKAIWVLVATGVIQGMENMLLVPRVMKQSMGVNPIIILLSLVAFGSFFGFLGALLALPLAAILQLVLDRVLASAEDEDEASEGRADVLSLIDESQRLMNILGENSTDKDSAFSEIPDADRNEIRSIAHDLGQVLAQMKKESEALE